MNLAFCVFVFCFFPLDMADNSKLWRRVWYNILRRRHIDIKGLTSGYIYLWYGLKASVKCEFVSYLTLFLCNKVHWHSRLSPKC